MLSPLASTTLWDCAQWLLSLRKRTLTNKIYINRQITVECEVRGTQRNLTTDDVLARDKYLQLHRGLRDKVAVGYLTSLVNCIIVKKMLIFVKII